MLVFPRGLPQRIVLVLAATLAGCAGSRSAGPGEHVLQVTDDGFEPKVIEVERGRPATLLVTRREDRTCATEMVFAALDTTYDLPLNQTVRIVIPADFGDTLHYSCAMDMYKGAVVSK